MVYDLVLKFWGNFHIWSLQFLICIIHFQFICRNKRGKPIIIDPGLHSLNKSEIWWVVKQRTLPSAFKLYTGFPSFSLLSLMYVYVNQISCSVQNGPKTILHRTVQDSYNIFIRIHNFCPSAFCMSVLGNFMVGISEHWNPDSKLILIIFYQET